MEKNYIFNIFKFDDLSGIDKGSESNKNVSVFNEEIFQTIASGDGKFKVERIISTGQITPEDQVYDQDVDELVFLIQGEAKLLFVESNNEVCLKKGDSVFIKANCKHKVTYTSKEPPCVWIAIHGMMNFR
jgi:cupin 2 domain-containing protein